MKFTMPVDKTVSTKLGHTILFEKDKATHVPKECWRDVQAAGAVPEDAEQAAVAQETPVQQQAPEGNDPESRRESIFAAFEALVEANKRDDFTAAGIPKTTSVSALTGFDVDSKERDTLWVDYSQKGTS